MSTIKVLKRDGVPYVWEPGANEGITEEEYALPRNGDWVEATNGKSISRFGWHEPVEPEVYVPPAIRKITKRSFMQRLDIVERIAIRKSTNDVVIDIREDLLTASNVDLDLQDTVTAVNYISEQGLLTVHTIAELLMDGTAAEEYRGI